MLDALEGADRLVDGRVGKTRNAANRGGGQRVLEVVPSGQRHRRHRPVLIEPDDVAARARREGAHCLVATVQHREIVGARELDGARLEVDISLERAVAVEMIRRDVEDHAEVKSRLLDRLELKARQLEDNPVARCDLVEAVEDRVADVAADDHRPVARGEHVPGQGSSGGLPVGTRDADDLALQKPARQFQVADHANTAPPRALDQVQIGRHPRRQNDEIRTAE